MTHADIDDTLDIALIYVPGISWPERLRELARLAHVGLDFESRPTLSPGDDYALPVDHETPGDEVQKSYFGLPVTYREGHTDPGPF